MSELHVVFGTGPIGRYTADTLLQQGHRVRMINRSGVMHDQSADIELITSDAFDRTQNIALTRGATAIYFCVAPAYSEWASKFPPFEFLNLSNLEIDFCVSLSGITSCLEFGFTIVAALIAAALPNTTRSINELEPNLLAP